MHAGSGIAFPQTGVLSLSVQINYTMPYAIMASATLTKPAMFAPLT